VVWWNDRPGNDDIYGRRVSGDGALIGGRFPIAAGAGHERCCPDVAHNSQSDEYLVVWEDDGAAIAGQRVSATGQLLGGEISIGGLGDANFRPAVAYASTQNKYLVVWVEFETATTTWTFAGKEVSVTGSPGSRFAIGTGPFYTFDILVDLAYNRAHNEFLVVWHEYVGSDYDVYGRRVKMAGGTGTLGPAFPIFQSGHDEGYAAVAAIPVPAGQGQYLVVCMKLVGSFGIQGQLVTWDGNLAGSHIDISTSPDDATYPAVAGSESAGRYLVVWSQEGYVSSPFIADGIMARAISADGDLVGVEAGIGGLYPSGAAVASGSLGDFLVGFDAEPPLVSAPDGVYGRLWGNRVYLPLVVRNAP
jgi:hypothetical protein